MNRLTSVELAVILFVILIFMIVCFFLNKWKKKEINFSKESIFYVLAFGLVVRLIVCFVTTPHPDVHYFFMPWAEKLGNFPLGDFYFDDAAVGTINPLNDYPPTFMYFLWICGKISANFNISSNLMHFLIMFPAIVSDIVAAFFLYKIATRFSGNESPLEKGRVALATLIVPLAYLLNPVIITNSAWWGQIDGITIMFMVMAFYFLVSGKHFALSITVILALMFKLQFVFLLPVLGIYYLVLFIKDFKNKDYKNSFVPFLKGVGVGLILFIIINLPFTIRPMMNGHPLFMLDIYINQVSSYPYYVLNATNLYGLLNLNFAMLPDTNFTAVSTVLVVGISSVLAILLYLKKQTFENLARIASLLILTIFAFSFKMHERYYIYAIAPLAVVLTKSKKTLDFVFYVAFSVICFITLSTLMMIDSMSFDYEDSRLVLQSGLYIFTYLAYFAYVVYCVFFDKEKKANQIKENHEVNASL